MAERVFDVKEGTVEEKARKAIDLLVDFYENTMKVRTTSLGFPSRTPAPNITAQSTSESSVASSKVTILLSVFLITIKFGTNAAAASKTAAEIKIIKNLFILLFIPPPRAFFYLFQVR